MVVDGPDDAGTWTTDWLFAGQSYWLVKHSNQPIISLTHKWVSKKFNLNCGGKWGFICSYWHFPLSDAKSRAWSHMLTNTMGSLWGIIFFLVATLAITGWLVRHLHRRGDEKKWLHHHGCFPLRYSLLSVNQTRTVIKDVAYDLSHEWVQVPIYQNVCTVQVQSCSYYYSYIISLWAWKDRFNAPVVFHKQSIDFYLEHLCLFYYALICILFLYTNITFTNPSHFITPGTLLDI